MNSNVEFLGINFKNPVIAASGTFGYGKEYDEYFDISILGGISTKGLTLHKKIGNLGRRIYETPSGLMNSIGLQNPGIDRFIEDELPFLLKKDIVILANLGGDSIEEYVLGAKKLDETDIPIIELNISCPNVKEGGMAFGIDEKVAYEVVKEVRMATKKKLVVKLSPNAKDISKMAQACVKAGADALSLVNTFNALAIDIHKRKPIFNNITAGLSGPCIKPIALRMVYEVKKAVDVPIIGIGGIMDYEDAIEFIMAGATLIQVGSANFRDIYASKKIVEGIEEFMKKERISNLKEITGIIGGKWWKY